MDGNVSESLDMTFSSLAFLAVLVEVGRVQPGHANRG